MNSITPSLSWQRILGYSLIGALASLNVAWAVVTGGIVTDGTMGGAAQILSNPNGIPPVTVTVEQDLGNTVGNNLFHSFSEFNIANGQTVEFTGSDALQNVISRVTGADVTDIEGTLKSSIANAAFYFINPNGITFGAGAHVDVPGTFHVSTADKIDFPNNSGVFYANSSQTSTLSSETPAAFGFLSTSAANNGLIEVNGAQLAVKTGQTQDMVAGEITVESTVENQTHITAPAGEIRLVAMQGAGSVSLERNTDGALPLPTAAPSATNAGNITVNASTLDTTGDGGGRIALWGGNTSLTKSTAWADNKGATDASSAKSVDIRSHSLSINGSSVSFDALGTGNAGNLMVETASSLAVVNGGLIKSRADFGNTGNLNIRSGTLDILNGGAISTSTKYDRIAGNVTVTADSLNINSQGYSSTTTGIFSNVRLSSSGQAGNVTVKTGTLDILNGGEISSSTSGQGNAGNVTVTADTLRIDGQGNSSTATSIISRANEGSGQAGDVTVQTGKLDIFNGGNVSSSTFAQGNAGNVTVTADTLTIDSQGNSSRATGIVSQVNNGSGQAGNVTVNARKLDILNAGIISNSTFAQGDAGNVTVTADTLRIDGQGNLSSATGIVSRANKGSSGQAGNVTVQAGTFDILNGGNVSTSTFAQGYAGNVTVKADTLTIDNPGNSSSVTGIFSEAKLGSGGQAGNVTVQAFNAIKLSNGGKISIENAGNAADPRTITPGSLSVSAPAVVLDDGIITAATTGNVKAGSVKVTATQSLMEKNASTINSSTSSSGSAGSVEVEAPIVSLDNSAISAEAKTGSGGQTGDVTVKASTAVHLSNDSKISIENAGNAADPTQVTSGIITVTAPDIDMKDSNITTNSTGNINAGSVGINFSHWLTMDPSFIRTTANTGNGGTITVGGGELIFLQNSGFITTVGGANSNGGDILVNADILLMDTGIIQANAVGGSGGNITLSLNSLIPSSNTLILGGVPVSWQAFMPGFNVIQAASQAGISGTVSVTAPQLNLSGIIANLGGPQFDTNIISQDYCGLGVGSSLTRQGAGGLKPKSGNQLLF